MILLTSRATRLSAGIILIPVGLALTWAEADAQEPVDSLRAEVTRLATLVDSLSQEVARLTQAGEEEEAEKALAELRAAAQAAAAAGSSSGQPDEQEFVGRQRSLQALNPEISVNADVFGYVNKDDTGEDNFFFREVEISIISNLDPFSRAKIFLSRHFEGGDLSPFGVEGPEDGHEDEHSEGFALEEGYVEWVGLPSGLTVKLGKFSQQFGQLNRWHAHALPFQTRSLPHIALIGEEALSQTGVSLHWLLPFGGAAGTYETTVEVTRSENGLLFGESRRPALLGHVNAFWNLSSSTDLDLGLSWMNGSYEGSVNSLDRTLYGAEMALTWRPPGQSRYRGFTIRGGVMTLDGLVPQVPVGGGVPVPLDKNRVSGFWGAGELRMSERLLIGARVSQTESPEDPDKSAWLASSTLTWWQSEYVRIRLEYDIVGRSFVSSREGHLLLQVTLAMGPHKHETY